MILFPQTVNRVGTVRIASSLVIARTASVTVTVSLAHAQEDAQRGGGDTLVKLKVNLLKDYFKQKSFLQQKSF